MLRVIQLKCDVVNVSFGETAKWNNDGLVVLKFMDPPAWLFVVA